MFKIWIPSLNRILEAEENRILIDVLKENKVYIENPCNSMGTCGKCKVRIKGQIKDIISSSEKKHLTDKEIEEGYRLSCFYKINENIEVEIPREGKKGKVLTEGFLRDFERDKNLSGYGIACDIGTTTVIMELVELATGKILSTSSMINPQKKYGLDVLTRITYEYEKGEEGIEELKEAIVEGINGLIDELVDGKKISREDISEMVIGANTTMLHLLLGIDARSMGKYPYAPVFIESKVVKARDLGINLGDKTEIYTLPGVSAFIGSDVVAGAYVCDLHREKGNVLFIDIGTNGEIVLNSEGRLVSCSCAAGPALEGMNISSGMRAAPGAIEELKIKEEGIEYATIDGENPVGLCGSGILAAVREIISHGLVKKNGAFIKKEDIDPEDYRQKYIGLKGSKREFIILEEPKITVSQGDVRQVQLAKGAILSGFLALLSYMGIGMEDLDKVLIAGQFGAHLPCESLVGCGILPEEVKDKISYVGNTSKTGAYMALLSRKVKEEISCLAGDIEYVELAVTENYENIFRDSMIFN